jgi:hypothetical protein
LQSNNLDKLNFVHNNWLNDLQIGCKPFFNLMELIETSAKLEKLKKVEKTFEIIEILEI